jgi:hypothetical protein
MADGIALLPIIKHVIMSIEEEIKIKTLVVSLC